MPNVKEKAAVDHFKSNYDLHLDYMVVVKHDLKGQTIKSLKDIKVDERLTLGGLLGGLNQEIKDLKRDNKLLENKFNDLEHKFNELELVFKETIKGLITR